MMTRGTKALDEILEETIYTFGYDIDFDGLPEKTKKLISSYAIKDPRFDLYEILTEREIDITDIIKREMSGEFNNTLLDFGDKIIESVIFNMAFDIDNILQEIIQEFKNENISANGIITDESILKRVAL